MSWIRALCPSCIIMALAACSTLPPDPPGGPSSSAVAIRIDERAPWSWFPSPNNQLLFVRLDGGPIDTVVRDSFVPSNFCRGNYFYLLNAPPGRYVVVGSFNVDTRALRLPGSPPSRTATFYDEKLVRQTEVSVAPGSFAFMGEFVVHTTLAWGADPIQRHYHELSHPLGGEFGFNVYDLSYGGYLKEVQRDDEARARFAREATSHFAETGWADILSTPETKLCQ